MNRILISACLLGERVRYGGGHNRRNHPILKTWGEQGRLVPFCPEVAGGLPIPREPAEIAGGTGEDVLDGKARVLTRTGRDVTALFLKGARQTLAIALAYDVSLAVLTERSPSCGSTSIHDGSFTRQTLPGNGVTAALLKRNGIRVFSEEALDEAATCS